MKDYLIVVEGGNNKGQTLMELNDTMVKVPNWESLSYGSHRSYRVSPRTFILDF